MSVYFIKKMPFFLMGILWVAILYMGFLLYGASGHDDPHINFWVSHTLLEQGQFVNYNGERVEQTTSLLIVLFTALFSKLLQLDLVTAGYLVDIFSSLVCCVLVTRLAQRYCPSYLIWPSLLTLGSTSYLLWSFGGMGAVLAAMVLLLAATVWADFVNAPVLRASHYCFLSAVSVLLVVVRPEMPVIIVVASASLCVWFLRAQVQCLRFLQILLISLFFSAMLFAWQKYYFDSWFPLPVLAKQATKLAVKLQSGFLYTLICSIVNPVILLILLCAPIVLWLSQGRITHADSAVRTRYTQMLVLLALTGVYVSFVIVAGGDWMQAGRFVVPVIPMSALLLTMMVSSAIKKMSLAHFLLLPVLLVSFSFTKKFVAEQTHGVPAWIPYRLDPSHQHYSVFERYNQEHLRDMAVIDHLQELLPALHQRLNRPVSLLSGQAGMVFYWLGQSLYGKVHFYDLRGLVEGAFTNCAFLDGVKRNSMGMGWSYEDFLPLLPKIKQYCGVEPPDVIYDLDSLHSSFAAVFSQYGYVMIHREEGFAIRNPIENMLANKLFVPNVIFVRKDLLPLLGNPELRVIKYKDIPLVTRPEARWLTPLLQSGDQ